MAVMSIKYSKGTCLAHLVVLLYRGHSSLLWSFLGAGPPS